MAEEVRFELTRLLQPGGFQDRSLKATWVLLHKRLVDRNRTCVNGQCTILSSLNQSTYDEICGIADAIVESISEEKAE